MTDTNLLLQELSQLNAFQAAKRLLGCEIERTINHQILRGKIVEVEAYDQNDVASHSYKGITKRNSAMFGQAGTAYVYFTYGMHYCLNVVVGREEEGSAVLIRALEPLTGESMMKKNRQTILNTNLLNGPAKLCQALAIDKNFNGHNLTIKPLVLKLNPPTPEDQINFSHRIGVKEFNHNKLPWRLCLKSSVFLSRLIK